MTVEELRFLAQPDLLDGDHRKALWYDLHGDWDRAHRIVQNISDEFAEWIHACLHREEGDIGNAKYWYARCGRPYPGEIAIDQEIATILANLP